MEAIKQNRIIIVLGWWVVSNPQVLPKRRSINLKSEGKLQDKALPPELPQERSGLLQSLLKATTILVSNRQEAWLARSLPQVLHQLQEEAALNSLKDYYKALLIPTQEGNQLQNQIIFTQGKCQIWDTRSDLLHRGQIPAELGVSLPHLPSTEGEWVTKEAF